MYSCRSFFHWWDLFFLNNVIAIIKLTFTVEVKHCAAFKYFVLNHNLSSAEIMLDQMD